MGITPGALLAYTAFDLNSTLPDIPENYVTITYRLAEALVHYVTSLICRNTGDFSAQDKQMDVVCSLIRTDGFEVHQMAHDGVLACDAHAP